MTENGTEAVWPQFDLDNQKYLDFSTPMSADSVKERFNPASVSFLTKLLPVYAEMREAALEQGKGNSNGGNQGKGGDCGNGKQISLFKLKSQFFHQDYIVFCICQVKKLCYY